MAGRFKLDENIPGRVDFASVLDLVLSGVRLSSVERTTGQLCVIDEKRVRIRD